MPTVEREAMAGRADGLNPMQRKNVPRAAWADLSSDIRRKLADVMGTSVNTAQGAINTEAPQAAAPVGDEQQFAPETGTLGIPRSEMPQIPSQSHGGLVKHLNAQGIDHETTMVDASELKPTQAEYSPSKVEAAKSSDGDRAIIVSSDGHIIDGHHQALAAAEEGKPVKAIVLDAPVEQALEAVKNSPSAQSSSASDPDAKNEKPLREGRAQPSQSASSEQTPFAESPQEAGEATTIPMGQSAVSVPPPTPEAQPVAAKQPTSEPKGAIQDFGQKIGGARKDVWSGFKDDLNSVGDDDIAGQPLAKVWPAPDYQKLIDAGMNAKAVAAVRALRDEVPAKPRAAWKVKRWAEQVKTLRGLANDVMDGKITVADMERMGANKGTSLRGMMGRIELYELVGHEKSLEGVRFAEHHYTLYRGRENVNLWVVEKDSSASTFSNWPTEIATGDTKEQALAAFKEKYDSLDLQKAVRKASFDIFSERTSDGFFIGKKIGRNYAKLEGPFKTVKEAREYRQNNLPALEAKLEKYKEIPRERADVNQPRVGVDMRNGQDVTPQMFSDVFGFRGVEFGNWVEQKRRQKDLNDAFDALMDMAAVLDIPTKAISLNGKLGLAFGARGSGGVNPAAAHYEPDSVVINLTKKEGAGSLGHEWWHALDNYFAKQRKVNRGSFMTTGTDVGLAARGKDYVYEGGIRQEMIDAFGAVVKAINLTAMKARASKLDSKRTKEYWTTGEEMSARAFESYLISKLQDQNASNDYLANVVSEKTWDAMAALGLENDGSYPYPTAAEIPAIRAGFDHFFQTVETRADDAGNVAMFSRVPPGLTAEEAVAMFNAANQVSPDARNAQRRISDARLVATQQLIDGIKEKWSRAPEIIVARNMQDRQIPQAVRDYDQTLKSQGATGEPRGFIYKGKVYLLSDELKGPQQIAEVLFHEVLGHYGLRGAFGDSLNSILQQMGTMRRRDVVAKAREYGMVAKGLSDADTWAAMSERDRLSAAEEVLAEMAQSTPEIGFVQRAIAAIRNWLRAHVPGFKNLALTDADIIQAYILPARGFVTRSKETGAQSLERAMLAFSRGGADAEAALRELAADAQAPGNANKTVVLGPVSSRQLELLQREGVPVDSGFTHAADMFAVRHALNRHGDAAVEAKQGQLPLGEADIAAVPKIIASADALILGAKTPRGQDIVGSLKRMPDGTVLYLEEVRSGRKTLAMTSMRKYPGTTDFETIKDRIVPSYARSDTGDVRIVYPEAATGQAPGTASDQINFSRAPVAPAPAAAATSGWDAPVQTGFDDVIYKLQDKNIDLKRVVESITKSAGHVADSINAYLKEELFHKRAAKRVADFGARELAPLMNQMRVAGLSMEDVEEYLHARHAKEANAVIAQRNPGVPGLQDGGSGMTNAAADNYFAKLNPTQRRKLEGVAAKVDAIIADTRKLYVEYGLEDQATVDGWAGMFQHYIPLMREDKEGGMGIGQGFSVKGKETKSRTGSTRKVVDILANIASQRERLIVRGEKNRVTQALVGLAQANPNHDFWEVRSEAPTERVFDQRTGVVVERPDPLFKSRENVVVTKVKDANGNVTEQMVVFNEDNPRAVRMAAAMKNLDAGNLEGLLGMSAKITRYFSAINTQYNPVFGVVNLVRDVQGAMVNLAATPLAGQQGKIAKDTVSALRGIYSDIRKTRRGGQATSQWAALWEQMQDDGGTTGYRELFTTSADRANNLKSILNPEAWMDNKWGKFFTANGQLKVPMSIAQKGATEIFGWLSDYNEAMENGVRLAAYKAALDKGMSREQAASLAKNLTVNFNRKGQVGMQAGAVYAFFNAAMQGTARIGQTLFDMDGGDISTLRLSKTGKAVVYGGVTLGVMQALALAGAGFDEEDPPEFVRERSLIIPTGGKTYVSIPMPLGLHVIPGIGRHATEFALSGFDKPAKRALSVIGMFADAFNPIGNAGLSMQTLAPTALDPLVALTENKDWTGKPIARVSFNKALPGHTQWKDTATWYSKMAAEAINWVSGGNEYVAGALSPTPDQIDYLVAQVGGGVAREASKVFQAASTTVNGEELPTYKIPLLGRFAGNAASQASQGTAFYANLDRLNALETEIKGLRKDGRFDEAAKLVRENPQATMIAMANRAERDVQKLRRDKRELIAKDASREEVRAKEDQITAVMMRLNEAAERRKAGRFAFAESE